MNDYAFRGFVANELFAMELTVREEDYGFVECPPGTEHQIFTNSDNDVSDADADTAADTAAVSSSDIKMNDDKLFD